jgi:hypothetical protein
VAAIRQRQADAAAAAEAAMYTTNPDAAYWQPRSSLPPNPAVLQAQQEWAKTCAQAAATAGLVHGKAAAGAAGVGGSMGSSCRISAGSGRGAVGVSGAVEGEDLAARGMLQGTFSYYHRM